MANRRNGHPEIIDEIIRREFENLWGELRDLALPASLLSWAQIIRAGGDIIPEISMLWTRYISITLKLGANN